MCKDNVHNPVDNPDLDELYRRHSGEPDHDADYHDGGDGDDRMPD